MSDLLALTRLALTRSRWPMALSLGYLLLMIFLALVSINLPWLATSWWLSNVGALLTVAALPTLFSAYAILGFGDEGDLDEQGTAYPKWLLRTPIDSWKLAAVPTLLKTLWVMLICGLLYLATQWMQVPIRRWFVPGLVLATIGALLSAIGWRPFYWRYTRITICALLLLPMFFCVMYSAAFAYAAGFHLFGVHVSGSQHWVVRLITVAVCGAYGVAFWMSIRSVRLARCDVAGFIPERALQTVSTRESNSQSLDRSVALGAPAVTSPVRATLFYHWSMLRNVNSSKLILAIYLVLGVFACSFNTVAIPGLITLAALMWMMGSFLTEMTYMQVEQSRLPNLVSSAPISTALFAWTRQVFVSALALLFLLGVLVVIGVWHLTGASDSLFRSLRRSLDAAIGESSSLAAACLAFALLAVLLAVRQSTWSVVTTLAANRRVGLYWFCAGFAIFIGLVALFTYRFMQFPDWESWQSWATEQSHRYAAVVFWLAGLKVSIASAVGYRLAVSGLASWSSIAKIVAGYAAVVLLFGYFVRLGLPFSAIGLPHWIAIIAMMTPLSRILAAPLVLAANRHQR